MVLRKCGYDYRFDYWFPRSGDCDNPKSDDISLVAGEIYWMEVFHREGTGAGHLMVAVETPPVTPNNYTFNSMWSI